MTAHPTTGPGAHWRLAGRKVQPSVGGPARSSGDHTSGEVRAGTRSLDEGVEQGPPALGGPERLGLIIGPARVRVVGFGWTRG